MELRGLLFWESPTPRPLSEVFNQCNVLEEFYFIFSDDTQRVPYGITEKKGKNRNAHGSRLSNFQNAPPCAERKVLCPDTLEIFLPVLYL